MGKRRRKGWMCTMNFWLRQLGTLEFWETLLDSFGNLGPIAPITLAMVESFFPPLPLIAIVAPGGQVLLLEVCLPLAQAGKGSAVGEPL